MTFARQGMSWKDLTGECFESDHCAIVQLFVFVEDELAELVTGEDVEIIFKEGNFLEDSKNGKKFKKALQCIKRNDLVTKFEIYIATGK